MKIYTLEIQEADSARYKTQHNQLVPKDEESHTVFKAMTILLFVYFCLCETARCETGGSLLSFAFTGEVLNQLPLGVDVTILNRPRLYDNVKCNKRMLCVSKAATNGGKDISQGTSDG